MTRLAFEYTMTESEYLACEQQSSVRHEYLGGYVHAMVGGTRAHNGIALNLAAALKQALRGSPCRVFINDIKVKVAKTHSYYYPDVVVTCHAQEAKLDQGLVLEHPSLIVEVLSTTTAHTDEREKWLAYQTLTSLKEYVMLDSRRQEATILRRAEVGWVRIELAVPDIFSLESVDFAIPLLDLYDGVELPAEEE